MVLRVTGKDFTELLVTPGGRGGDGVSASNDVTVNSLPFATVRSMYVEVCFFPSLLTLFFSIDRF
jgi:hypothetical protein